MDRAVQPWAHRANEFYLPGSTFAWRSSSDSAGAYFALFPRPSSTRYAKMRGRARRMCPCSINEGSETRVLLVFGLQNCRTSEPPRARRSCWARTLTWSPHFKRNPLTPIRTTCAPFLLVSLGRAVCGIFKKTPGGSAFLDEWWLADESSWRTPQTSTFWQLDKCSFDVMDWGRRRALGGSSFDRSRFMALVSRRFAAPPNRLFQGRGSGLFPT